MGEKRQTQIKEFLQKENIRNYTQLSKFIFEYNNYPRDKNFFEDKCSDYFSSVLYLDGLFRKNKIEKLKSFFSNNMWTQNNTGAPFNFTQTSTADEFKAQTEDYSDTKSLEDIVKNVGGIVINSNSTIEDSGYIGVNFIEGDIEGLMTYIKNSLVEELNKSTEQKRKKEITPEEIWNDTKKEGIKNTILNHKKQEGIKHNSNKLPMSKLFEQFPDALQAIVLCSSYGAKKYKETDVWDNFKKVQGGSKTYEDALVRHFLDDKFDKDSGMPHLFHRAWNALSALQLWIEEEGIDIQEYSAEKLKEFENKFA